MSQRLNLQYSAISFSASGDNTLISANAVVANSGMRSSFINVWGLGIVLGGITNVTFKDGSTALTGAMPMVTNGSFLLSPTSEAPWFIASPGNAFILNSSAGVQVSGWIIWSI